MKVFVSLAIASLAAAAPSPWTVAVPTLQAVHAGLVVVQEAARAGQLQVTLEAVKFDAAHVAVKVIDDPKGQYDLPSALAAHHCVAGVNGGYFQPDHSPAGLLVTDGQLRQALAPDKLLTGVVTAGPGQFGLLRVEQYTPSPKFTQVRQAGPYLVDGGKLVPGLNATRRARRTAVLTDGHGGGALLTCDALPLSDFAALLLTPGLVPGLKVSRALNLDGGPSTAFYCARPRLARPQAAPVRDYIGLAPLRL